MVLRRMRKPAERSVPDSVMLPVQAVLR